MGFSFVWGNRFKSEDSLKRGLKDAGEDEGQGERRDVPVALDRINALAGDSDEGSEVLLGPVHGLAEFSNAVVDGGLHLRKAEWKVSW
jgi:hypothetical protein